MRYAVWVDGLEHVDVAHVLDVAPHVGLAHVPRFLLRVHVAMPHCVCGCVCVYVCACVRVCE